VLVAACTQALTQLFTVRNELQLVESHCCGAAVHVHADFTLLYAAHDAIVWWQYVSATCRSCGLAEMHPGSVSVAAKRGVMRSVCMHGRGLPCAGVHPHSPGTALPLEQVPVGATMRADPRPADARPCGRAAQVQKELDEYGDIVFVKEKTNYKSILVKTYFVLEYAALHYDARYILKTDDDAYINIGALLRQLRLLCQTADCRHERLYMGKMAKARAPGRPPGAGCTGCPRGPAPLS
jgi:hypothetical protein